jgi:transcriptional regulator
MHPSRRFHIEGRAEIAALVRAEGFGTLIAGTAAGLRAVHVPVVIEDDRLRFHVSRSNLLFDALQAGADALFVVNGPHAYVSPDWYGLSDRVPTWSYLAVELNGPVRPLPREALVRLLDDMSAEQEEKLAPKPPWVRGMMNPARFDGLVKAIAGFEMTILEWRGTAKVDQDKPEEVRDRIAAALRVRGDVAMAALYEQPFPAGEGASSLPLPLSAGEGEPPLRLRPGDAARRLMGEGLADSSVQTLTLPPLRGGPLPLPRRAGEGDKS